MGIKDRIIARRDKVRERKKVAKRDKLTSEYQRLQDEEAELDFEIKVQKQREKTKEKKRSTSKLHKGMEKLTGGFGKISKAMEEAEIKEKKNSKKGEKEFWEI